MLSPARVVRWPICSANCCSVDSRCLRSAWSMRRTKLRRCWSEAITEGDGITSSHMVGFSIERTLAGVENVVSHGEDGCIMVDDKSWECCTGLFNTTMDWARVAFKLKWENALGLEHTRTKSTRIHLAGTSGKQQQRLKLLRGSTDYAGELARTWIGSDKASNIQEGEMGASWLTLGGELLALKPVNDEVT